MSHTSTGEPAPQPGTQSTLQSPPPPSTPRQVITDALLVVLSLIIGAISVAMLSAVITQTRLSSISLDGANLSIWKLSYIGDQWADTRLQREEMLRERQKLEKERDAYSQAITVAQEEWRQESQKMNPLLDVLSRKIGEIYPDLSVDGPDDAPAIVVKVLARKSELSQKHPDTDPVIKQIEERSEKYRSASENFSLASVRSRWYLLRINSVTSEVRKKEDELYSVISTVKASIASNSPSSGITRSSADTSQSPSGLDAATRSRIENAFYELNGGGVATDVWRALLTIQPDMLTLFLVLAMGILGSSLQVTHAAFKSNATPTLGGYFLRLLVGALTALIIFIVAKAGVPVIADAKNIGSDGSINPYFVSFLAIVSGLLSENAIANIQTQGARIFGQAAAQGTPRWARRDITADIQLKGISPKELSDVFEIPTEQTEKKLKGEIAMTQAEQKLVVLTLRADQRELFTDISPA